MSVTEQFESWGNFSLTLRGLPDDTTPAEVWRAVDPAVSAFGHILITPTRVDPSAVGDAGLLSMAKYAGIYRGTRARNQLTGVGMVGWLGDEDEKGDIAETPKTGGAKTFAGWVADVLPAAITAGSINAIAGTLNESMLYMSPRAMLARVMDYFGGVYRVNPDGTLDAGLESDLFAVEPNHLLHWRGSGPDGGLHGLRPATIELARDLEDYSTKILMLAEGEGPAIAVGSASAGSVPYKDLHGNAVVRKRVINAPDVAEGNANTLAAAQLGRFNQVRTGYQLSTSEWGVAVLNRGGKRLEPGDYVWVYDPRPDARLVDPANQVVFQGETITPALMRLEAITWPILEGMGVYLRYYDGTEPVIVDLSPHIAWETGETTLEVGAAPRRITEPHTATSAVQARVDSTLPLGLLAVVERTSNQTGITGITDLTGLTDTLTMPAGRRVRVTGLIGVSCDAISDTTATLYIRDQNGTLNVARNRPVGNNRVATLIAQWVGTPNAGTWSPKLSLQREVGSGSLTMHAAAGAGAFLIVEDLGPV